MRVTIKAIMAVALGLLIASDKSEGADTAATAREQYQALLDEFQHASAGGAPNDEERLKVIGRVFRLRNRLAVQFVELAEKYPKDPVAVDALAQAVWQVNTTPWPAELVGPDEAARRALALLAREHIGSEKLGGVCERLAFGFRQEYEPFLRTVLQKSPHRDVRGLACLGLGRYLSNRLHRLDLIEGEPALAKEFADLFSQEYLGALQRRGRAEATREAEGFFEQAANDYGDVKTAGRTVGDMARAELFEMRHLVVGKEAPEIEGQDQQGKPFKLSDYRGKVVLLDFWQEY